VAGLGKGGVLTVVGCFEFGRWDVAAGLVEAAVAPLCVKKRGKRP
jgi:hypothetical protein